MRLLNTKSLEFGEFFDSDVPKYAILSHRWGEQEVTFKEFKKGKASEGPGLNKIREFCALAAQDGFGWIWIDTCCIDKRSSAELSEAINSMYRWYKNSDVCYVYLADVCYSPSDVSILRDIENESRSFSTSPKWIALKQHFCSSSWFSRGWTLQELLAPCDIKFFDKRWTFIGRLGNLRHDISETTGINIGYLSSVSHTDASIAQKMSWASRRETSRGEDLAYCLLGLFDINMPLLYGEGADKAFYRLQAEILRTSNDESIFAWTAPLQFSDILAPHPRYFMDSGDCRPITGRRNTRPHYTLTNKGLQMSIPSLDLPLGKASAVTMHLYCTRTSRGHTSRENIDSNWWDLSTHTSSEETLEEDCASSDQALVVHLFRHKDSYLRFRCHTLEDTLRKPHPLSSAESDPNSFCAIYILCSRVPLSLSNGAQCMETEYKKSRKKMSSMVSDEMIDHVRWDMLNNNTQNTRKQPSRHLR